MIQLGLAGVASALDARQYWRLLAACGGHFHAAFRLSKIRPQGAHLRIYSHSIVRMHHNVLILHDKLFFTCPVYRQLDRQKLTLLISLKNFG